MPLSGDPVGSDLPPDQARLDRALVGLQIGRLNSRQVQLLADVVTRRAGGSLQSWEAAMLERFERAGVYLPSNASELH